MRNIYLAIPLAILFLLLVACGSSDTPAPETGAASEQPTAVPEQPTTAPEQATPVAEQPTAAPEQPTTATEQTTAAAEQPTTAPEQPTAESEQGTGDSDQVFKMQFVCINRSLQTCDLFAEYIARVEERSNGQLELEITSFPELGISGTDMLDLLADGTIEFTELPGNFVGGSWPFIEIAELYGLFPDSETQNKIFAAVRDDEIRIIRDRFGGRLFSTTTI